MWFFHCSPAVTKGLMWLYAKNTYLPVCFLIALLRWLRDLRNFSADKNFLERRLQGKTSCVFVRIPLLDKHYSLPRHSPCIYILCILVFFSTPLQLWEFVNFIQNFTNFQFQILAWLDGEISSSDIKMHLLQVKITWRLKFFNLGWFSISLVS